MPVDIYIPTLFYNYKMLQRLLLFWTLFNSAFYFNSYICIGVKTGSHLIQSHSIKPNT